MSKKQRALVALVGVAYVGSSVVLALTLAREHTLNKRITQIERIVQPAHVHKRSPGTTPAKRAAKANPRKSQRVVPRGRRRGQGRAISHTAPTHRHASSSSPPAPHHSSGGTSSGGGTPSASPSPAPAPVPAPVPAPPHSVTVPSVHVGPVTTPEFHIHLPPLP